MVDASGASGASGAGGMSAMQGAGASMQAAGLVMSAVGTYYGEKSRKLALESQARTALFQSQLSGINERIARRAAFDTLMAGRKQIAMMTLQSGLAKSSQTASMAARGIQAGVGSARDVMASMDFARETDALQVNSNATRQAGAQMMEATQFGIQGMMQRAQARNIRAQAKAINPWMAMAGSLLGGGGQMMSSIGRDQQMQQYYGRQGQGYVGA